MNRDFLREKLNHLGLPGTLAHYFGRSLHALAGLNVYRLLYLAPAEVATPRPKVSDLEYGLVDAERLRREALDSDSGLTPSSVESELAKGDPCFGAFVGGTLASYVFVAGGRTNLHDDVQVCFDPRWVFSRWAFTRQRFRGLHLHAAVKHHALGVEVQRGRQGILSLVEVTNFESLGAGAHLGCRRVGLVATARPAGRRLVWTGRSCGEFGLSLQVTTHHE
jgi:hypothetical protein